MENFLFTINAILPIILLIVLGYFLKRLKLFTEGFWKEANKLCFRIFIPVLLFYNIYKIENFSSIDWKFIGLTSLGIVLLFVLGFLLVLFLVPNNKQKGVIWQCTFRSNYAIIGIPLATSLAANLLPAEAEQVIAIASIISAFSIPLFNIFAVISLSVFDKEENNKIDFLKILKKISTNPLIIGVLGGLLVLGIRNGLEALNWSFSIKENIPFLYDVISKIQALASPLALIVLGGQFTFKAISKLKFQIILGTAARVVITPAIFLTAFYLLGYRTIHFPALIGLFATPIAVSSAPMASDMGQDEELAGQLVVWTSIASIFTLFFIIMILTNMGVF